MFGSPINSGLTFAKVLSGLSKTLNIAKEVIPLYQEAKPLINNAKNIISVFKNNQSNNTIDKTIKKEEITSSKIKPSSGPNFFL